MSHQPPFFCPYCGDEGLRPHGEQHGEWQCEACRRVFLLRAVKPAKQAQSARSGAAR